VEAYSYKTSLSSDNRLIATGTGAAQMVVGAISDVNAGSYDGTTAVYSGDGGVVNAMNKYAVTWGAGRSIVMNSSTVGTGAYDGAFSLPAIGIGVGGGDPWGGTIRNVRIGQRQLSSSELQAVTL
jgi:hypothetical protein